jgi:localization factor PodJL
MSNSELSAGQRRGVDPLDFSDRDDGRADLKSMLDTIAAQLLDADQRHTAALTAMHERITGMGREADEIRPRIPEEFAPAFAQIETAMVELAQRLADAGDGGAASPKRPANHIPGARSVDAATPMALRSGANRRAGDRRQRDEGPAQRTSPVDPFDVIESVPGDVSDPWDRDAAEALAGLYDSGAVSFSLKGIPAARPGAIGIDHAWLENKFAEIANGIEQSLAAMRSDNGVSEISQRLDQFERQFAKLFEGVATHDDLAAVHLIEAHVGEVVNHLVQTQDQLERLNVIEAQLATISHTLADVQGTPPGGMDGAAHAKPDLDVDAIARAAAEQTAQRFANLRNDERHSAADELRPLIERLMSENRHGEEQTASLLDTMQQAMIRLLDRVDSIEFAQQQGSSPAPDYPGYRGATFGNDTAGHSELIEDGQGGALDAAVAAISSLRTTPGSAAQLRPRDTSAAPDEFPPKTEKVRQDFVAEARRAKMRLAAEQDELTAGAPVSISSSAAGTMADPLSGSRPIRPSAAPTKNKSGPSAPSPRLMLIAVVALIALGGLWYTFGLGGSRSNAVEAVGTQPAASAAQLPDVNGAATSGASDAAKSAPTALPHGGNADKTTEPSSDVNGPHSDLAPGGAAEPQNAPSDSTARRTTALPMLGVAVDLDQPVTEAELQQAKRHQAMASISGELGNEAAQSGNAAAVPASMVPSEAETEGVQPRNTAGSVPASSAKSMPLDMPAASVGPLSLRLAAANGDSSAEFEVGARLAEGKGTPQSFKDAAKWYQRSADHGFAQAQYRLGTLYERGLGLKSDRAQAAAWYQRAAEQGNMKAMHNLAVLSANQNDQSPDYTTAAQWFEEAAQRGLPDSQFNLAVLYENGLGVKRDLSRAFMWLSIASRNGDADAVRRRDILRGKLTAEEIAVANTMIAAWKPMPSDRVINDARAAGEIWKNNPKNGISG